MQIFIRVITNKRFFKKFLILFFGILHLKNLQLQDRNFSKKKKYRKNNNVRKYILVIIIININWGSIFTEKISWKIWHKIKKDEINNNFLLLKFLLKRVSISSFLNFKSYLFKGNFENL